MTSKFPLKLVKDVPTGRAISIRQPYVEEILCGIKKYEYRSRQTHIRGRVFLYASKGKVDDQKRWNALGVEQGDLPLGMIVGSVEIVDCRYNKKLDCYEYKLKKPKRYRTHLVPEAQAQPLFFYPFGHF